MTSVELRRQATEQLEKLAKVVEIAEKENRETTPDEDALVEDFRNQSAAFDRRAKKLEKVEKELGEARQSSGRTGAPVEFDGDIEPVRGGAEGDKRKNFSHWLSCVDSVSNRQTAMHVMERSRDDLNNLYRSEYKSWDTPDRSPEVRREARNLAMNSGTAGGYLMPEGFYKELMAVAGPLSLVRPRATVIPMMAETIKVPSLDQTTAQTAGSPPYYGGVVLTWTGESATINSTEPGFRQTTLTLNEVTGYTPVGRTLLAKSAISLEPLIYKLFGGAVAFAEDYAFLRGNGVGKPLGILSTLSGSASGGPRLQTSARASGAAITFADATNVWTSVLGESQNRGEWFVSKAAESTVLKMTGTANSVFFPTGVYTANTDKINAGPAGGAAGVMLFMRPVNVSAKLPALDVDGDFNFFDFSSYLIADGGPPEVASSDDYLFRSNERAFRIVHRVGGSPWLNNAITLEDGTTKNSPFVSLGV